MQQEILHYKEHGSGNALVILHGLFGSLDNWQSLGRKFADHFRVISPDLRNHGRSFHSPIHDYRAMTDDVLKLMDYLSIEKSNIIGHSMGGKVAMNLALHYPDRMNRVIVCDIAPVAYEDRHYKVFNALKTAPLAGAEREAVADHLMKELEGDKGTVMFLMKSLIRDSSGLSFRWRFNLDALASNYPEISSGVSADSLYTGPVLFVKGADSEYISAETYPSIVATFPNHELEEIRAAGHWLHADQPDLFFQVCMSFLLR